MNAIIYIIVAAMVLNAILGPILLFSGDILIGLMGSFFGWGFIILYFYSKYKEKIKTHNIEKQFTSNNTNNINNTNKPTIDFDPWQNKNVKDEVKKELSHSISLNNSSITKLKNDIESNYIMKSSVNGGFLASAAQNACDRRIAKYQTEINALVPITEWMEAMLNQKQPKTRRAISGSSGTIGSSPLDRFFIECVCNDLTDFNEPKTVAKAEILAKEYGISTNGSVKELYDRAKNAHKAALVKEMAAEIAEKRKADAEQKEKLERYADITGVNKKITILNESKAAFIKQAQLLDSAADMRMRMAHEQEHDWALMGGIANGLAGPGAGIATALDFQAQNETIRRNNQIRMQQAVPELLRLSNSASDNRKKAELIQNEIDATRVKLVVEEDPDILMNKVLIDENSVVCSLTKAGSVYISASAKPGPDIYIYGDTPAYIDGTLLAELYSEDNQLMGTAKCSFPVNGLNGYIGIQGLVLGVGQSGKKYTVKFKPYKLWLMEV